MYSDKNAAVVRGPRRWRERSRGKRDATARKLLLNKAAWRGKTSSQLSISYSLRAIDTDHFHITVDGWLGVVHSMCVT